MKSLETREYWDAFQRIKISEWGGVAPLEIGQATYRLRELVLGTDALIVQGRNRGTVTYVGEAEPGYLQRLFGRRQ